MFVQEVFGVLTEIVNEITRDVKEVVALEVEIGSLIEHGHCGTTLGWRENCEQNAFGQPSGSAVSNCVVSCSQKVTIKA